MPPILADWIGVKYRLVVILLTDPSHRHFKPQAERCRSGARPTKWYSPAAMAILLKASDIDEIEAHCFVNTEPSELRRCS